MESISEDAFLSDIKKNFSNNQKKQLEKLIPLIGEEAAISLIGIPKGSKTETEVVAHIISDFKPFEIFSFRPTPRKVVLQGVFQNNNYIVRIHPQYYITQPAIISGSKEQYWEMDLAIELHKKFNNDFIRIATFGFEYDGHIGHYVESEIKKNYLRNAGIMYQEGFMPIHIAPEHWKKYQDFYKETMMKHFYKRIEEVEMMQSYRVKEMYLQQIDTPELIIVGEGLIKQAIPLTPDNISKYDFQTSN